MGCYLFQMFNPYHPIFISSQEFSRRDLINWRCHMVLLLGVKIWILIVQFNQNNYNYHIFCCNMFIFACLIIARSQCWLFPLKYPYWPSNIRIGPQISVFAPEFNFWYLRSGLKENVKSTRKDGEIVFQSN